MHFTSRMNNTSKSLKKLTLNRETIQRIDNADLGDIYGGATPSVVVSAVFTASVRLCQHSDKIARGVSIAVGATKWAVNNQPKGNPDNPPSVVGATA